MSRPREFQVGDLVVFPGKSGPLEFEVVGVKSWKTLWVRWRGTTGGGRLAAARKRLRLVMSVEERVARSLMWEES